MKPGTDFNTSASLALLLLGESGTGKSSLAIRFDRPGFVLGDKNIKHAADWAKAKGHAWSFNDPELNDKGERLGEQFRWARSMAILKEAGASAEVGTIVDDGLTHLSDFLKAALVASSTQVEKVQEVAGEKLMNRTLWEPFQANLKRRIVDARSFQKPYIMIAHLSTGDNELTGTKEQQVSLQGALRDKIGGFFTDVWQVVATPSSDAKYKVTNGIRRYVRCEPTHRCGILKNSMGFPAELDVEELCVKMGLKV